MTPFGDRAFVFPVTGDARTRRALLDALRASPGVVDAIVAETACCVVFDDRPRAFELPRVTAADLPEPRAHAIDVVYDGADLDEVAAASGMSRTAVVDAHTASEHTVAMVGFMPGFAYLRGLDTRLALPRRANPRARVPPRSVAIAAGYSSIYPWASPGGWHLLGRAPSFVPWSDRGATLALGDRVHFVARTDAFHGEARGDVEPARPPRAIPAAGDDAVHVEIMAAQGPVLVVDGGRRGHMHEGVPHGGPLVNSALARANLAVGNAEESAALEVYGTLTVAARRGPVTIAADGGTSVDLEDGATFTVAAAGARRARYVAIAGGVDAPIVLGSRTTLLLSGLVRRGDRLALGGASRASRAPGEDAGGSSAAPDDREPIEVILGPDEIRDAVLETLLSATFTIARSSDRVGTRLEGPPLDGARAAPDRPSTPMIEGAIELTPSGLVVLGPDHPTTGGYPVVAVVRAASRDAFFARPIGSRVRFTARAHR